MLIAARAVQGFGAAIVSPSTLSIITTTFEEGPERNKALGIWGAMGGSGAAAGVLFGGILVKYLGWEWIFFVNVPVGALVLALTPGIVRESRAPDIGRDFDAIGASSVTGGLALLVYAISKAPVDGWGDATTIVAAHRGGRAHRLLPLLGDARREPADAALDLPHPHARRRERRRLRCSAPRSSPTSSS